MIETEVKYSDADYVRAVRYMTRQGWILITTLAIFGIIFGFVLQRAEPDSFGWWVILAIFGMLIFVYFVNVLTQRWNVARQLRKIPDSHGPYTWVIDTEGIRISGALSNSAIKWAAITKVRESTLDFFFYVAPRLSRFLPKRNLTDDQRLELRRLITECAPGKAKLAE